MKNNAVNVSKLCRSNNKSPAAQRNHLCRGKPMENALQSGEQAFHIKFDGKMTHEFYGDLESRVKDAMQRHEKLAIDLSGVSEIDLCGIHLIGLLKSAGVIVATSPVVEQATRGLLSSLSAAALGRAARTDRADNSPASELRTK